MPCGRDGERSSSIGRAGFRCELPPGTYDVRVEPMHGCSLSDGPRYSAAARRVEVFAGATTQAEITLGGSGWLELTVSAPAAAA